MRRGEERRYVTCGLLTSPSANRAWNPSGPLPSRQLEKFKFVLDFKIKELKRQIEPRETEIGSMKEQIKEMDRELEQVNPASSCLSMQPANAR